MVEKSLFLRDKSQFVRVAARAKILVSTRATLIFVDRPFKTFFHQKLPFERGNIKGALISKLASKLVHNLF